MARALGGWLKRRPAVRRSPHENHELCFMMLLIRGRAARRSIESWYNEEMSMKWETPLAIDYRFGMEITMYVSNR